MMRDTREGVPRNHAWSEGDKGECGIFLHGYDSLWLPTSLLQAKHQPRENIGDYLKAIRTTSERW
jgi:FRG domain